MGQRKSREHDQSELTDLKSENKSLRRLVARLRKQLSAFEDVEIEEDLDEEKKPVCNLCGDNNFSTYVTPSSKVVTTCRNCKKRVTNIPMGA